MPIIFSTSLLKPAQQSSAGWGWLSRSSAALALQFVALIMLAAASINTVWAQDPPEVAEAISIDADAVDDSAIESRLDTIYGEIEGLEAVEVSAEAGVVTLTGITSGAEQAANAGRIARAVQGVVAVENQLERDNQVGSQLRLLIDKMRAIGSSIVVGLPLFIIALVFVALFWLLGGFLAKHLPFPSRLSANVFVEDLARLCLRLVFLLIGLVIAAQLLDATAFLASVVGGLGVLGLAVGFAIRDTVENFIASILLSIRQPFSAQDHVLIEDDVEGKVVRLTSRATILMDFDGNRVRLPNSTVYKAKIVNFTKNPKRRFQFEVGIDTDVHPPEAQALAVRSLQTIDAILDDPAPQCNVKKLGDSNVVLLITAWIDQTLSDFTKTQSVAMSVVKQCFEQAGVTMPEPIYRLRIDETGMFRRLETDRSQSNSASALESEQMALKKDAAQTTASPIADPAASTERGRAIETDTGPDHSITEQVEQEIMAGEDLLTKTAPKE